MSVVIRPATAGDLDQLLDVQHEGALAALTHIFPQELYPFPRSAVRQRWAEELDDPAIHVYVCVGASGQVIGFAATRGNELLHFGTAPRTWGTGTAQQLHKALITELARTAPPTVTTYGCVSSMPIPEPGASMNASAGVPPMSAAGAHSRRMPSLSSTTCPDHPRPSPSPPLLPPLSPPLPPPPSPSPLPSFPPPPLPPPPPPSPPLPHGRDSCREELPLIPRTGATGSPPPLPPLLPAPPPPPPPPPPSIRCRAIRCKTSIGTECGRSICRWV